MPDQRSIAGATLHVSACSHFIAALIPINIDYAIPVLTLQFVGFRLREVARRASECGAIAIHSTAAFQWSISAICVKAKNVTSVIFMFPTFETIVLYARPFFVGTFIDVSHCACCVPTPYVRCNGL
jgi:hypothetical protein